MEEEADSFTELQREIEEQLAKASKQKSSKYLISFPFLFKIEL